MSHPRLLAVSAALLAALLAPVTLLAEDHPKDGPKGADELAKKSDEEKKKDDDAPKPLAEVVGKAKKLSGLVTFYRDAGKLHMELPADLRGRELGLSALLVNAVGDWAVRGSSLGTSVVSWDVVGERLVLTKKNLHFRADPKAPLAPVVAKTFPDSPVFVADLIELADEPAPLLIDAKKLFGPDLFGILPSDIGWSTSGEDATLESLKVFADNVVARVRYRFRRKEGGDDDRDGGDTGGPFDRFRGPGRLADPRNVEVTVDYNLYRLPEDDGYRPRAADERIGGFTRSYKDYTDIQHRDTAFRHILTRWDVRKTDPSAELSPAKEPITFYVDRGVPAKWRPLVHRATLWWNTAFEKVGIKDAIRVLDEPTDDPEWDPADIRHSMIYWNVSDNLVFSGMAGPTFTDPRTGKVIGANIYLNAEFPSYTLHRYLVYAWWRAPDPQTGEVMTARAAAREIERLRGDPHFCDRAASFSSQIAFARLVLQARGQLQPGTDEAERFAREAFEELVAHEVGHALGFPHNWKASLHSKNADLEKGTLSGSTNKGAGIFSSSVMDYNPIYLAPRGKEQGDFFMTEVGPYDDLAVEYIYRPFHKLEPDQEAAALDAIAAKAETKNGLIYDGGGLGHIDPTTSADDIGDDPIAFAEGRFNMIRVEVLPRLAELVLAEGHDYNLIRQALDSAIFSVAMDYVDICARHVGGQILLRRVATSKAAPEGGPPPIRPVSFEDQRRALLVLEQHVLADGAFALSRETLAALKADMHPDWNYPWRHGSDYDVGKRIAGLYAATLQTLLEPARLNRILDNERRAPEGASPLTLPELLGRIEKAAFGDVVALPAGKTYTDGEPMLSSDRRALQRVALEHLLKLALQPARGTPAEASQIAWMILDAIAGRIMEVTETSERLDRYSHAHLADIHRRIKRAQEASTTLPAGR